MVNDVDVLVEELGFVCACRTRRDTHDGHDDGHDDAQLLTNQVWRAEFISFVHRLEQRAVASQAETKMSQPDKVSPLSPLISLIPNQY